MPAETTPPGRPGKTRNNHIPAPEVTRAEREPMAEKTDTLHIRITPELKQQLQQAAQRENRTVSNYIELLIRRELQKQ